MQLSIRTREGNAESAASSLVNILEEADREFYPQLLLFKILASFKGQPTPRHASANAIQERRRKFLDSFSYLCDTEKGGATVTAAALQRLLNGNILWLAANEGVRPDIKDYAFEMLERLKGVRLADRKIVEDEILSLAIQKGTQRIEFYKEKMRKFAVECRMDLRKEPRDSEG
jgi:hypothetical protein